MSTRGSGMFTFKSVPNNIRDLLILLADTNEDPVITIILEGEEKETVKVEAVTGNMLVATVCGDCNFKFIDIDCICAVIVKCEDILEGIFRNTKNREC